MEKRVAAVTVRASVSNRKAIHGGYASQSFPSRNLSFVLRREKNGSLREPWLIRLYNRDYVSPVLPHRGSRDTNLPRDLSRSSLDSGLPARSVAGFVLTRK